METFIHILFFFNAENAREAMDLADEWLGVPKLLTPEDFVSPNVDEQSMLTYLSQFPNAKLAPGAPLRKKTNAGKVNFFFSFIFFTSLILLKCQMMHNGVNYFLIFINITHLFCTLGPNYKNSTKNLVHTTV